jgi:hypothetical protein
MTSFMSRVYGKKNPNRAPAKAQRPPPPRSSEEEDRRRDLAAREAIKIGFQRRRLPGEDRQWR